MGKKILAGLAAFTLIFGTIVYVKYTFLFMKGA